MTATRHSFLDGCFSALIPPGIAVVVILGLIALTNKLPAATPSRQNAGAAGAQLASFFTPEVLRWEDAILRWSAEYDLDPNLIATLMQIESCGNPQALSSAGAQGLFQVMPYHFDPQEDAFDPQVNARRGLAYLQTALAAAQGNPRLALAAYNGGIGLIGQPEENWPDETRRYVYYGAQIYADAQAGRAASPRLDEWLANGGRQLCEIARRIP